MLGEVKSREATAKRECIIYISMCERKNIETTKSCETKKRVGKNTLKNRKLVAETEGKKKNDRFAVIRGAKLFLLLWLFLPLRISFCSCSRSDFARRVSCRAPAAAPQSPITPALTSWCRKRCCGARRERPRDDRAERRPRRHSLIWPQRLFTVSGRRAAAALAQAHLFLFSKLDAAASADSRLVSFCIFLKRKRYSVALCTRRPLHHHLAHSQLLVSYVVSLDFCFQRRSTFFRIFWRFFPLKHCFAPGVKFEFCAEA